MAVHVSDISLLLPYAVRFQMYTARNGGMMPTALSLPVLPDVPDVDPVVQLPDDVVLKAGLLATVTVCVCAPADSVLAVTELSVPCTAYLAVPDAASFDLICLCLWAPADDVVAVCVCAGTVCT